MDPITPSVISGLVVRALGGGAGAVTRSLKTRRKREVDTALKTLELTAKPFILPAISSLIEDLPEKEIDGVARFLQSPEADIVVRATAVAILTKEYDRANLEIEALCGTLLNLIGNLSQSSARRVAPPLLRIIANTFRRATNQLFRSNPTLHGSLIDRAMSEKKSGYLTRATARNIRFSQFSSTDLVEVARFIDLYRPAVNTRNSELVPAYFDIQKRVPIDPHYVVPRFNRDVSLADLEDTLEATGSESLSFTQMLTSAYRTVILGDPGAGKSTLIQKLAHEFSTPKEFKRAEPIPFIIPMRSYEESKRSKGASLLEFMVGHLKENFHINTTEPVLEYIFLSGRGLVMFDGLDELLDIMQRREMVSAIEAFSNLYSSVTVVVTSRSVGYNEAPVNPSQFQSLRLMNFTEQDVAKYAENWFSIDESMSNLERSKITESFLHESATVSDIRQNALMLGLLCNVYRGIRTIPEDRADLYEKCAEMLFERWDTGRGITSARPLKADAKSALQDIALWAYTSPDYAKGIPRSTLKRRLTRFWKRRYETIDEAESAASSLLNLWRGRTWVLTDVGTSISKREEIYKFTHRTFLEYFAACELVKQNPSPLKLWKQLFPRIKEGGWDIVSQLAIQKLDAGYSDAADTTIGLLLDCIEDTKIYDRTNVLAFAARNLGGLYIKPLTCRRLVRACVDLFLEGIPSLSEMPSFHLYESEAFGDFDLRHGLEYDVEEGLDSETRIFGPPHVFEPLLRLVTFEGSLKSVVPPEMLHYSKSLLSSQDREIGARAFLLIASSTALPFISAKYSNSFDPHSVIDSYIFEWKTNPEAKVLATSRVADWSEVSFWVPITAARSGLISLSEMLEYVSADALVCTTSPFPEVTSSSFQVPSFAELALASYLNIAPNPGYNNYSTSETEACLEKLGRIAGIENLRLTLDADWGGRSKLEGHILYSSFLNSEDYDEYFNLEVDDKSSYLLDNIEVSFGAAILLAYFIESEEWSFTDYSVDQVAALNLGPISALEVVFVARMEPSFLEDGEIAINRSNLSGTQKSFLLSWMKKSHNIAF